MVSARLLTAVIAGCAVGACAGVALAGAVSAAPNRPAPTQARNERAARQDATGLLQSLQLPAAATRLAAEPVGDGGALKPMIALTATTARADVHAWWRVPGGPGAALAYLQAHPPAGSTQSGTESGYTGRPGRSIEGVTYTWAPVAGVLGSRELEVSITALAGNATGVFAQAESDWIVPRPAGERIPTGVREVDVTSAKLNGPTTVSLSVTRTGEVRRIVALFDAMPVAQPATYSCPAMMISGARVISFTFRAHAAGPALAQATYTDFPALGAASGPCAPIDFAIRGRTQDALIGGAFVRQIERIAGASLTAG